VEPLGGELEGERTQLGWDLRLAGHEHPDPVADPLQHPLQQAAARAADPHVVVSAQRAQAHQRIRISGRKAQVTADPRVGGEPVGVEVEQLVIAGVGPMPAAPPLVGQAGRGGDGVDQGIAEPAHQRGDLDVVLVQDDGAGPDQPGHAAGVDGGPHDGVRPETTGPEEQAQLAGDELPEAAEPPPADGRQDLVLHPVGAQQREADALVPRRDQALVSAHAPGGDRVAHEVDVGRMVEVDQEPHRLAIKAAIEYRLPR